MTDKQKAAAAAAGLLTAAAVAAGLNGGDLTSPDGGLASAINTLKTSIVQLAQTSERRGMELQDGDSSSIEAIIAGLDGMEPTAGEQRYMKVSAAEPVEKGDFLRVSREFSVRSTTTFASGGVNILAVTTNWDGINETGGYSRSAFVVYTKSGYTYFVPIVLSSGKATVQGRTVLADVELENVELAADFQGNCYVAYTKNGVGRLARLGKASGSSSVHRILWDEPWMESGDPTNLHMAYEGTEGRMVLLCTRLPEGSEDESERYPVLVDLLPGAGGIGEVPDEIPLTADRFPCLAGISYDTGEGKDWDIVYATNYLWASAGGDDYREDEHLFLLYISFPCSSAPGRGIIVAEKSGDDPPAPVCWDYGILGAGALAETASVRVFNEIATTLVVESMERQEDGEERRFLAIEAYRTRKQGTLPVCQFSCDVDGTDGVTSTSLSVGELSNKSAAFVGYTKNGRLYGALVTIRDTQPTASTGNSVDLVACDGFGKIVSGGGYYAAAIYQNAGIGYISMLNTTEVVVKTGQGSSDGVALEDGAPGAYILADMTYSGG